MAAHLDATPRNVLFDLDGTLSDSAPGILAALRHAFVTAGVAPLDAQTERAILGPPFYESLPPLIGAEAVGPVIAAYREFYGSHGMYDTSAFPGVNELVQRLHAEGRTLAVATSKPEHYAVPIIEHLGLAPYFTTVGGDTLDGGRPTKALVIADVLQRLGDPAPRDVVMVGDRSHDVLGAREHGIDTIAVRWGYAMPGELEAAAPAAICSTAPELDAVLHGTDAVDAAAS
jgi:phosphoglycolate phosphatase